MTAELVSVPAVVREARAEWVCYAERGGFHDRAGEAEKWKAAEHYQKAQAAGASLREIAGVADFSHTHIRYMLRALVNHGLHPDWSFADCYAAAKRGPEPVEPTGVDEAMARDPASTLGSYLTGVVKQLVFSFANEEYGAVVEKLERIGRAQGLVSNTEIFMHVLDHYEEAPSSARAQNTTTHRLEAVRRRKEIGEVSSDVLRQT